jgi:hypothetical protein
LIWGIASKIEYGVEEFRRRDAGVLIVSILLDAFGRFRLYFVLDTQTVQSVASSIHYE